MEYIQQFNSVSGNWINKDKTEMLTLDRSEKKKQ